MATIAEGGLFPPIIEQYLPAFNLQEVMTTGLNLQFSTSPFESDLSSIYGAHISITRQSNYESVFSKTKYPLGIYPIYFGSSGLDNKDVEVTIPFTTISDNFDMSQISYNEYYKVQVRFSNDNTNISNYTGLTLSTYLTNENNLSHFSEWSTVCLIRFIAPPKFQLDGNATEFDPSATNVITSSMLTLSGAYSKDNLTIQKSNLPDRLKFGKNDLEYLASYIVQVILNDEIVFQSPEQELNIHNPNSIYYNIPYYFEPTSGGERDYAIKILYTTANLYTDEIEYNLNVNYSSESWGDSGNPVAEITSLDSVIGKVNINITPIQEHALIAEGSKVIIRRGCETDDFTIWDTVYSKVVPANSEMINFNDFTIESGLIYKYEINYIINNTTYTIVEGPVISVFDHSFLTGEGVQLCVKFNPNIGNYRKNVSDSTVTTIGSKYPYITRNGAMNYRSFSLSGTIAYEMDIRHQFTSRSEIYGDWINVYGSYFSNHFFNQRNDRVTQRKFREMVEEYLYDDVPKLFRSTPEGNILVRITDVSLTPNNQLGRMIYDFSCTATEIGDCTIDNYKLYEIQDFGDE